MERRNVKLNRKIVIILITVFIASGVAACSSSKSTVEKSEILPSDNLLVGAEIETEEVLWKQAYLRCIQEMDSKERIRYALMYLNDDNIPELCIDCSPVSAVSGEPATYIWTYGEGEAKYTWINTGPMGFVERKGLVASWPVTGIAVLVDGITYKFSLDTQKGDRERNLLTEVQEWNGGISAWNGGQNANTKYVARPEYDFYVKDEIPGISFKGFKLNDRSVSGDEYLSYICSLNLVYFEDISVSYDEILKELQGEDLPAQTESSDSEKKDDAEDVLYSVAVSQLVVIL